MHRPWLATSLALLLACGGDGEASKRSGTEDPVPGDEPPAEKVRMGPLANAGPDQRALPGMVVRLDGRGTVPPEDGRPFRHHWLQEAGPRVLLSDPTSEIVDFVAPPLRPGAEDRLVFRLVADDGSLRSSDRVAIELVEESELLASAPAAVAGAEIEARPGEEVEIPPPSFVNPSCLHEEDREACFAESLPFCWTQVAGPRVSLTGACGEAPTRFDAPTREGLLVFRLDAHAQGLHNPPACGPEALIPVPSPLCAAPDYLRVVVRETPRRAETPPATWLRILSEERERVEIIEIGGTSNEIPGVVELTAGGDDPERWRLVPRYRPVLGRLARAHDENRLQVDVPTWPGPVGIAFDPWFFRHHTQGGQTRMEWMRAAPSLAVLSWMPPSDTLPLLARIADRPCGASSPEGICEPLAPGEEVVLAGELEGSGVLGCWEQTFGPRVDWAASTRCTPDEAERRFIAPTPPGDTPLELAFQFSVGDAGLYESRPSTLWLQIRPEGMLPPAVEVDAPEALEPGTSIELDASASTDPQGGPLSFRWRQLAGPAVGLRGCTDLPQEACMVLTLPLESEGRVDLELEVGSDASGLITRRRIELAIEAGLP